MKPPFMFYHCPCGKKLTEANRSVVYLGEMKPDSASVFYCCGACRTALEKIIPLLLNPNENAYEVWQLFDKEKHLLWPAELSAKKKRVCAIRYIEQLHGQQVYFTHESGRALQGRLEVNHEAAILYIYLLPTFHFPDYQFMMSYRERADRANIKYLSTTRPR